MHNITLIDHVQIIMGKTATPKEIQAAARAAFLDTWQDKDISAFKDKLFFFVQESLAGLEGHNLYVIAVWKNSV